MQRIAIIGVGLLGTAVAQRLLAGGFSVVGYDTRTEQIEHLRPHGLKPAGSIAEAAAGADAIFTILPSLESVQEVMRGPGGLFETSPQEAVLLQMSTITPGLARALGEEATKHGLAFLDTPISGTSAMVARGDCTIMAAGQAPLVDTCRPIFDAIARKTVFLGAVGLATLAKLAVNLVTGLNAAALAEAFVFARKGGLDPDLLLALFRESAASSRTVEVRGPLMVSHRFEPQMKLELFLKDFTLMLEEGKRLGVPLPQTSLARELCVATVAAGRGREDFAAILTTLERMAGL